MIRESSHPAASGTFFLSFSNLFLFLFWSGADTRLAIHMAKAGWHRSAEKPAQLTPVCPKVCRLYVQYVLCLSVHAFLLFSTSYE